MTILDNLLNKFKPKPQKITNDEAEELAKLVKKTHGYFYIGDPKHGWCKDRKGSYYHGVANAIKCLYSNGGLSRKHTLNYSDFYRGLYFETRDLLFKIRHYYERGKLIRKAQHGEILKLRAEIKRLKSDKQSRLEQIGDILSRFHNGSEIAKNCYGEWVITTHDGEDWRIWVDPELAPAGLWKDTLQALKHLDKPVKKDD
jgi:hypothetical protein